ncbi:probable protein phosphatase 2C 8 [Miscanthus floridulus]|uniref:probable protein phosphatase 2C 8 n=1 Tax=Miscanthus floridulus TaxID=154761 RepID=UPI00345AB90B
MSSSEASAQDHGVPALEAQDSTHDHGVPALDEAPTPADTDKILAAVAQLARRRRLEARRLGRTASAGAQGEASKRARPVSDASADSSRESAKVAPEPREGASAVVPPGGWPKSVSHGAMSVIGRRREMEDAFAVDAPFLVAAAAGEEKSGEGEEKDGGGEADAEFFAVYDGHGGSRVADACRERLHVVLAEEVARLQLQLGKGGDGDGVLRWREAMEACFARVDGEVVVVEREANKNKAGHTMGCGSTAVVAVVGPRHIVVANCGDSRAVLSRGGVPVPLSSDHKPDRPDELERVESAGGRVINWNGYRVLGVLSTSRSIGDYYMKPFISAEPEVTVTERTHKDEFIILASDGLWDVMTNEEACKVARNCLCGHAAAKYPDTVHGSSGSDAAAMLVEFAMSRGSTDNISVVVVELKRLKRWKGGRQNGRT